MWEPALIEQILEYLEHAVIAVSLFAVAVLVVGFCGAGFLIFGFIIDTKWWFRHLRQREPDCSSIFLYWHH